MKRASIMVAAAYGVWIAVCVFITVFKVGDGGVNAHLALMFTGPPASLLSLLLPHGSLVGVVAAGALGLAQWVALTELWLWRRSASHGA